MLKSLLNKIALWLLRRAPQPADEKSADCARQLVEDFRKIKDSNQQLLVEDVWSENLNLLFTHVLGGEDPRVFLRWDVVQDTMFIANARFVRHELVHLKSGPEWGPRWRSAILEDNVGSPFHFWGYPKSSGNRIHHAYHLAKFEEVAGRKLNSFSTIVEFGGGYGGMCRLAHKLGFRGRYIIYDLPIFLALQKYYIQMLGMPLASGEIRDANGIHLVSEIDAIPLPDAPRNNIDDSLFIATWSLSECPIALRAQFLPIVSRLSAFLIAYQHNFEGIDNSRWFEQWPSTFDSFRVVSWDIEHMRGKNSYLIGLKNDALSSPQTEQGKESDEATLI